MFHKVARYRRRIQHARTVCFMADGEARLLRQPGGMVNKCFILLVGKKIFSRMAVDVQWFLDLVGSRGIDHFYKLCKMFTVPGLPGTTEETHIKAMFF